MNLEKLLQDVASLPPVAQREAIDFIDFLKWRYGEMPEKSRDNLPDLENEPFIGMWRNRTDMTDSTAWVRKLRAKEWRT